MFLSSRQI